jgi:hypothetical protein
LSASRGSLLSQFSNLPFRNGQSSFQFLLIPPRASSCEDVQGSQHSDSSSQSLEPWTFHNPFLRWLEHSPESMHWDHFFSPTHLHELDFKISDDMIYILTHDMFVLDLSLFWFMMNTTPILLLIPLSRLSRSAGYARDVEVLMRSTVSTCPRVGARCYPRFLGITRRSCLEAHRS